MKAFLLAAGRGTRLRPLTDKTPKCLLPVHGKPILEIWLRLLAKCGIQEVLVNTHHLHAQVEDFIAHWKNPPVVSSSYEPQLLGSAGTLYANRSFVEQEDFFLVCYADNWTNFDPSLLIKLFLSRRSERPFGVMALHRTKEPSQCGIVTLDNNNKDWIQTFAEKPKKPLSDLANSGIYLFAKEAFNFLPANTPSDIAHDFIPKLIPKLLGLEIKVPLIDIGTPQSYYLVNP